MTCVIGDNCLVIHNHNRPLIIYSYDPKDSHRCAKTGNSTVGYWHSQSGQKYILIIHQAIQINGLKNHWICHGVHISEVPKFLADSPNATIYVIHLLDPFHATYPLIILL